MEIVIDIPYHVYEHAKNISEDSNDEWDAMRAIANGTPYEERPRGEWQGKPERRKMVTRICTSCGDRSVVGYFCMWCGSDNRVKEGEKNE